MDVAILGFACRLPGAPNPDAFWRLLAEGRCAVTQIPADRFPTDRYRHPNRGLPGKSVTFAAGIIDDPWGFDPAFFGLSPREAVQMDPQQRILLQTAWEALEDAGIPPSSLAGSRAGVFVGASGSDYMNTFLHDPAAIDVQVMTGNTLSIISNRISYILDLRGPSFTVDTACSSSLVALHEALEAIRAGRIDTAIVGGVSLLLSPFSFIGFSHASMLSATGLCRAFDAAGDGYVRAEGAVTLVLKSASALAADDRPRAIIAASGINSDGRTVGLSLPSADSQAALLRDVYDGAGIDPAALAFVEAHGTGTRVGDPAEATALGRILGKRRAEPLPIGSAKSNIGHTEPVAGLVGVLKAALALEHDLLPASLHIANPNPDIPFEELNLRLAREPIALPRAARPRFAGINSFGFGGANAHAAIRDPDSRPPADRAAPADPSALVVSAQSREALIALARNYRERVAATSSEREAAELAAAAAHRRDRLSHRLIVRGGGRAAIVADLDRWLAGEPTASAAEGRAVERAAKAAFVFSGNGSQWAGMGRAAYAQNAVFRSALERVDRHFMGIAGWSLLMALWSEDLESELERTEVAQPLLFAVQVALVEALRAAGLTPAATLGHSVGEVAAAWAAGALSLADAARVIHARSTNQEVIRELGGMAALLLSPADARAALEDPAFAGVEIAAINSPRGVTVSGPTEALDSFLAAARARRWSFKRLDLAYPFHSRLVEPIRADLLAQLDGLKAGCGRVPFVSTVGGETISGAELGPDYWWENVRRPVLLAAAVKSTLDLGCRVFVEIGPRPVLISYLNDAIKDAGVDAAALGSLDRAEHDGDPVPAIVDRAFVAGAEIDEACTFGPRPSMPVALPTYPWQNRPFRPERTIEASSAYAPTAHPLLGAALRDKEPTWAQHLDLASTPWLADHRVEGAGVLPAAAFAEMALAAAADRLGEGALELADLEILAPLVLETDAPREIVTRLCPDGNRVEIASRPRLAEPDLTLHATARVALAPGRHAQELPETVALGEAVVLDGEEIYGAAAALGLNYGPAFRRLESVRFGEDMAVARYAPRESEPEDDGFVLAPSALDAAFHGLLALVRVTGGLPDGVAPLPVRIGSLRVHRRGSTPAEARLALRRASPRGVSADFWLFCPEGRLIAELKEARFKAVRLTAREPAHDLIWRTVAVDRPLAGANGFPSAGEIATAMEARGLVARDRPKPGPARLLVDAAFRAAAAETASALARGTGRIDLSRLPEPAQALSPLASRLLLALEEDGTACVAEDGSWHIESGAGGPPLDILIQTILADHPEWIAEAAIAAHLATALPAVFVEGAPVEKLRISAALQQHADLSAPAAEPIHETLGNCLAAILDGEPRVVLCLGVRAARQALTHISAAPRTTWIVTDPHAPDFERLRAAAAGRPHLEIVPWSDLGESRVPQADIAIGADLSGAAIRLDDILGVLPRALRHGGLLLLAEPAPALALDMTRGIDPNWWRDTVSPDVPVGAALSLGDWRAALAKSGFLETELRWVASADAAALFIAAKVPAASGTDAGRAPSVAVLQAGDRGEPRFAAALADRLVRAGGSANVDAPSRTGPIADDVTDVIVLPGPNRAKDAHGHALWRTAEMTDVARRLPNRPLRLWLVSRGGLKALTATEGGDVGEAAVVGFARVLRNERPDFDLRLVDLDPELTSSEAVEALAAEISAGSEETEILLGRSGRRVTRLLKGLPPTTAPVQSPDATAVLGLERQGSLDSLAWIAASRREPQPHEVEIEVAATGLNFRDVMWAQGLLPEEALEDGFAGPTLGMECAGTVIRVGESVSGMRPGDRVVAIAPAAFAGHVVVDGRAVAPVPAAMSFDAAATVPIAFLTAHYALVHLGRLQAGETVLIHGGAGGVGLAALQIAKGCDAQVIATAGSPEKRALLARLGADHVFSSRDLGFADAVMGATGGAGVDVVLNSLAGEAMERSLACLKPFGRFLELGKRDFYAGTRLGLRPFRRNISYFGIDADQLLTGRAELGAQVFREAMELFACGEAAPLPFRVFEAEEVVDAFRLMQQSGHIGKIVVRPPARATPSPEAPKILARPDARYLLVGGFGGFGLAAASWLADRGARHLVVAGRNGPASPEAKAALEALAARGVIVEAEAVDAADEAALGALLDRLAASGPPLAGIFHMAMVLDDGLIAGLDAERLDKVLRPKVRAADLLDRLTRRWTLDWFVLFSSATTLVGNPGQASYVAANAVLEAIARRRRAQGLPGLAIAWGAISDVGVLSRSAATGDTLARRLGRGALTAAEALAGLDALLAADPRDPAGAALGFARIDWATATRELAALRTPYFRTLGPISTETADSGDAEALRAELAALSPAEAAEKLAGILAAEIGRILRLPPDSIARHRPLSEIGMDSLMALELRTTAEQKLGIEIPLMSVANGATLADMAGRIARRISGGGNAETKLDLLAADQAALAGGHLDLENLEHTEISRAAAAVGGRAAELKDILS